MNREELKAAIKKAYEKGYHEGAGDVCDLIAQELFNAITNVMEEMKKAAQKCEVEAIDEYEEEE